MEATTILAVRTADGLVMGGDGQVTHGNTILKAGAVKVRRLAEGAVLAGFAGSTADAFSLFERFEAKLKDMNNNMVRAAVELAKEWRTDKILRRLEALLIVGDRKTLLLITGNGDVVEPEDGVTAIGSGGPFALAAAKALLKHSKLDPEVLGRVTSALPPQADPRLVVGLKTSDDAGVVRLPDGKYLIQTLDFFTPIVDDPYTFGAIAAANSLSDVYAMGATPMTAMNILCWDDTLPEHVLQDILLGGLDKVRGSGALLVGGHSVTAPELKFGLSVTAISDRYWANEGARPGDVLVLTKALGTGVISTAFK